MSNDELTVIYPTMVAVLFTSDIVEGGLLSCAIGGGVCCGQFFGAFFATYGGHIKWKLFLTCLLMTAFTGALAGVTTDRNGASALATLSAIMIGAMESMAITLVTIVISDQSELGTGVGAFGSLRAMSGVVASKSTCSLLTKESSLTTRQQPYSLQYSQTRSAATPKQLWCLIY